MKRGPNNSYESGVGGPMKRPRGDKFETRLLVPSKIAGSLIGKGGSNIQKLRSDNNANVRIPDCPGPERIMTILADGPEVNVNVLKQSLPFMSEDASGRGSSGGGGGGGGGGGAGDQMEVRLLIHQSIVGGIIGRGGFKIKEIRETSGASIKVYQNCAPQSTDRCVSIQGNPEKIGKAAAEIFEVVANTEIKGPDEPYDPLNYDAYYASEYGGHGSDADLGGFGGGPMGGPPSSSRDGPRGRGGFRSGGGGGRLMAGLGGGHDMGGFGSFRGGGGGAGGRVPFGGTGRGGGAFDRSGRGGGGFGSRGGGYNEGFGNAGFGGNDQGFGNHGGFGGGRGGGFGAGGGGFGGDLGGGGGGVSDDGGEQETTQVTIPKDMAGAIIGPGGTRIRKIRNDSKATITIEEPAQGATERVITISGTQRQIQTAQYLLQQSVRENAPAHLVGGAAGGGGGGQGGYGGY